jgi:hypothetical protein
MDDAQTRNPWSVHGSCPLREPMKCSEYNKEVLSSATYAELFTMFCNSQVVQNHVFPSGHPLVQGKRADAVTSLRIGKASNGNIALPLHGAFKSKPTRSKNFE